MKRDKENKLLYKEFIKAIYTLTNNTSGQMSIAIDFIFKDLRVIKAIFEHVLGNHGTAYRTFI